MKIISVVGARPNFMKIAPIHKVFLSMRNTLSESEVPNHLICHTGQHYDEKMSKVFFDELELPKPDFYLGVGSGTHAEQTAIIMIEFEKILLAEKPDLVIVVGDVNSTIACSLTAVKLGIKVAHVEAGLRSFNRTMPEEINRILTDSISDYLFVTEKSGYENLRREGIAENKTFFVGNIMIDSLLNYLPKAQASQITQNLRLKPKNYIVVTLHRPSNVDSVENLKKIIEMLNLLAEKIKVVFPVHPRTRKYLDEISSLVTLHPSLIITEPSGYLDFISLMMNSKMVLTDSGGIQEETTYLSIPCVTLRNETERPITVEIGTNYLAGVDTLKAFEICNKIISGQVKKSSIPELWDGHAADKIVEILMNKSKKGKSG